jgi:hypothetical protein
VSVLLRRGQEEERGKRTREDVDEDKVGGVTRLLVFADISESELLNARVDSARGSSVDRKEDDPGNDHAVKGTEK